MITPQQLNFTSPSQFALSSFGVAGTNQKYAIDRTWPLEEILLICNITHNSTAGVVTTPDGLLNAIQRIQLTVNDGVQPRTVVDFSGIGLLEYNLNAGLNLDPATWEAIRMNAFGTIPASAQIRITYRIPLVHPMIQEPLRSRMLLDIQNHPQDPVLSLDFATAAAISTTGAVSAMTVEVVLIKRRVPVALNAQILSNGGYIPFDLVETPFSIAVGTSGEQRFPVPVPGQYLNLSFRHYLGTNASSSTTLGTVRTVLDQTTTVNSESRWRLESGGVVFREWRWKHLQILNSFSRPQGYIVPMTTAATPFIAAASAGSPTTALVIQPLLANPTAAVASNTNWQPAATAMLDFLTDGLNDANELGSLLDCNLPSTSGLKMEIIGPVAAAANVGSLLYISGHRLFGDLRKWQTLAA